MSGHFLPSPTLGSNHAGHNAPRVTEMWRVWSEAARVQRLTRGLLRPGTSGDTQDLHLRPFDSIVSGLMMK
jgi:hypothetical protein